MVIRGGGNRRTRGKPPTLDGRPLPCHMPTPGYELKMFSLSDELDETGPLGNEPDLNRLQHSKENVIAPADNYDIVMDSMQLYTT